MLRDCCFNGTLLPPTPTVGLMVIQGMKRTLILSSTPVKNVQFANVPWKLSLAFRPQREESQ